MFGLNVNDSEKFISHFFGCLFGSFCFVLCLSVCLFVCLSFFFFFFDKTFFFINYSYKLQIQSLKKHTVQYGYSTIRLIRLSFCFIRSDVSQAFTLTLGSKPTYIFCHLEDFGCGDGGWTPVLKIDGNKVKLCSSLISRSPRHDFMPN